MTERTPFYAWRTLGILMLFNVLSLTDRNVIALLVDPIKRDLQLTDMQFGLVSGLAFALLYSIVGLPLGVLADRISRKLILWAGVSIWSLGSCLTGLASSLGQLFGGRMALGMGEAALMPCAFPMISGLFPKARLSLAFGLFMTASNIGFGVALAGGGFLYYWFQHNPLSLPWIGTLEPWRAVFLTIGVPGLALALLAFITRDPPREPAAAVPVAADGFWNFLVRRRAIVVSHFLGFPVLAAVAYGLGAWVPAFFGRRFGWEPHEIGPVLAVANVAIGSFWAIASGALVDWFTARGVKDAAFTVQMTLSGIGAPICFAAFMVPDANLALILLCLGMFMYGNVGPAAFTSLQIITPAPLRGRMGALFIFMMTGMGYSLGPFLVATVTDLILRDEAKVGLSMLIVMAVLTPIALVSLASGRSRLRAIAAGQAEEDLIVAAKAPAH